MGAYFNQLYFHLAVAYWICVIAFVTNWLWWYKQRSARVSNWVAGPVISILCTIFVLVMALATGLVGAILGHTLSCNPFPLVFEYVCAAGLVPLFEIGQLLPMDVRNSLLFGWATVLIWPAVSGTFCVAFSIVHRNVEPRFSGM